MKLNEAVSQGYKIISRRHRIAARIDRPDWREVLAKGLNSDHWLTSDDAEMLYLRMYSKDRITVPASWIGKLRNAG
jgi:hypothetical protein